MQRARHLARQLMHLKSRGNRSSNFACQRTYAAILSSCSAVLSSRQHLQNAAFIALTRAWPVRHQSVLRTALPPATEPHSSECQYLLSCRPYGRALKLYGSGYIYVYGPGCVYARSMRAQHALAWRQMLTVVIPAASAWCAIVL